MVLNIIPIYWLYKGVQGIVNVKQFEDMLNVQLVLLHVTLLH